MAKQPPEKFERWFLIFNRAPFSPDFSLGLNEQTKLSNPNFHFHTTKCHQYFKQ
jgi:hypothetical protein